MNNQIQPYHFTKNIGKDFKIFFENVLNCNGVVCFDFEDSINTLNQDKLGSIKNIQRKTILETLTELSSTIDLDSIGFRINGTNTKYYFDDLEAISKLDRVNCIFLPKAESRSQVEQLLVDLPNTVKEIIPIIETNKGFENIQNILSLNNSKFHKIAFGHCDYNLSNHYFPFFHQDSTIYWDWIELLVKSANQYGKKLINSPVLELNNTEYFTQILQKNKSYKNITGQITLCYKQTYQCAHSPVPTNFSFSINNKTKIDSASYAQKIVADFEMNKISGKYFAIDKDRILISPQEYELAKNVLKKLEK